MRVDVVVKQSESIVPAELVPSTVPVDVLFEAGEFPSFVPTAEDEDSDDSASVGRRWCLIQWTQKIIWTQWLMHCNKIWSPACPVQIASGARIWHREGCVSAWVENHPASRWCIGKFLMLATDVDDDLPTTVPAFSGLIEHAPPEVFLADGNTESTMRNLPIPALADSLSCEVDVSGTVTDGHQLRKCFR